MAATENYAIDLLADTDYADENWCQLLAYLLSSPLGNFLKEIAKGGVLSGWTLGGVGTSTGTVAAGSGLVNGCMGKTTTTTNLTGLTSGAVNYVYATTDATSHTDARTVDFTVSLSANNPAGTVRIGSVTVAAGGSITAVDDDPTAYPRDRCSVLRTRTISGAENEVVTVGSEAVFLVDHSADQTFDTTRPSTVRITYADDMVYARTQIIDGGSFYLYVWNDWESGYAYGYPSYGETGYQDADYVRVSWERVGYVA
jgi:hypothetical protein